MSNKTLFILLSTVLLAMGLLFILNMLPIFLLPESQAGLSPDFVSGSALIHQEKPYTLNFSQQNRLLEKLNEAFPIENPAALKPTSSPLKLEIYRFNQPTLHLTILGSKQGRLVMETSWSGTIQESGKPELEFLLNQTYDP